MQKGSKSARSGEGARAFSSSKLAARRDISRALGLSLFNPQSHQWSLNWANGADAVMTTPMVGRFVHGEGQFYDQEEFQGRIIMARNGFSAITPNSSRFEQAFSDDASKTWETNWIMTFTR